MALYCVSQEFSRDTPHTFGKKTVFVALMPSCLSRLVNQVKLKVIREPSFAGCTLGKLYLDGAFFCDTLEDVDRKLECGGEKIYGETAIPRGTYKVVLNFSNRFKRVLPQILDVKGFEGIRIHPGNTAADTHGCILVGSRDNHNRILRSRIAFDALFSLMEEAEEQNEDIEIEVT